MSDDEMEAAATRLAQPKSAELARLDAEDDVHLKLFVEKSPAGNTVKAYKSDLKLFEAWCRERRRPCRPAPPETVARCASTSRPASSGSGRRSAGPWRQSRSRTGAGRDLRRSGVARTLRLAEPYLVEEPRSADALTIRGLP
jgi:hypothetical protein